MRLLKATALTLALSSGSALADDFPQCFDKNLLAFVNCPGYSQYYDYDWNGFYIGAHAGYADLDLSGGLDLGTNDAIRGGDLDVDGFAGGGQAGVNFQQDFYVLGLEFDASAAEMEASVSQSVLGGSQSVDAQINGFGSIRARLGFAIDEILPYVTAGVGLVSYEVIVDDAAPGTVLEEEDSAIVGVVGGGLEIGLTQDISVRGEGLYYYIDEDVDFTDGGGDAQTITIEDLWTLRGGLNWRF